MVIPERHHKNNSILQSLVNAAHATDLQEIGAILDVELPHFLEFAIVGAILSDELSCDSDWLCGVNRVFGSRTIELGVAQTVGLNVAAVLVTDTLKSLTLGVVAAIDTMAASLPLNLAGVHGESSAVLVCLPDVNLSAAGSIFAK